MVKKERLSTPQVLGEQVKMDKTIVYLDPTMVYM
jgi:hypothetical protein